MKESRQWTTLCAAVFGMITLPSHAVMISSFSFQSAATICFSEDSANCQDISTYGLSGTFQLDLSVLDASGAGSIPWNNFIDFNATNSVSNWSLSNLRDGGVLFSNGKIVDFGIDAYPDYSNGWSWTSDGGGELLLLSGFGVTAPGAAPAFTQASSGSFQFCPSTGEFDPGICPGGTVGVMTLGIQAEYTAPMIQAIPVPAALWLFGSGLLGLTAAARRKKTA